MNPAAVVPATVLPMNSRLVIGITSSLLAVTGQCRVSAQGLFLRSGGWCSRLVREGERPEDGPNHDVQPAVLVEVDDIEGRTNAGLVVHQLGHETRAARRL